MEYLQPQVGLSGKFKLKPPLTSLINENIIYTVIAVQSIEALTNDDIDVEQIVYIEQGLSSDDYEYDLEKNIPIVVLTNEANEIFNIPARYISYMPQTVGKEFVNKAILVNLGFLPVELNVDFLIDEIEDLIKQRIGIEAYAEIEEISDINVIDFEKYDLFEKDRLSKIENKKSCRSKLQETEKLLSTYKEKMKILLKKVKD